MPPVVAITAAISLVEYLWPQVQEAFKKGEITAEDQSALMLRINALRDGSAFQGKEWEITPS